MARFFLEIDLKRKFGEDWGAIAELNDLEGDGNVIGRLGFFYLPPWQCLKDRHAFLFFKIFPYETDAHGAQLSFAWNKKFPEIWDSRLSAGGFCDLNFNAGPTTESTVIVTEHQIRVRLVE